MNRQEAEKIKDELIEAFRAGRAYERIPFAQYFIEWFDKAYPPEPEYIPYEYTDFSEFMLKKVRRKGEEFKDEEFIIFGCLNEIVLLGEDMDAYKYHRYMGIFYSAMLEEWEFVDGKPFGKLKK